MRALIDNCEKLRTEKFEESNNEISKKSSLKQNKFLGLYISASGDNKTSYYVYGTLNDFMSLLDNNEAKELCKGYKYIELSFAYKAPMNEIIYKYIHLEIPGQVIIYKSDQTDIDKDIHRNLIKLCGKAPKLIRKCEYCYHIIPTGKEKLVDKCYFKTCSLLSRHSHYLCDYCLNRIFFNPKNRNDIKNNIKFIKPWFSDPNSVRH